MTEAQGKRMLVIEDELWDKVTRRAFNQKASGDKAATYSSVVREGLKLLFPDEKIEGDKP